MNNAKLKLYEGLDLCLFELFRIRLCTVNAKLTVWILDQLTRCLFPLHVVQAKHSVFLFVNSYVVLKNYFSVPGLFL